MDSVEAATETSIIDSLGAYILHCQGHVAEAKATYSRLLKLGNLPPWLKCILTTNILCAEAASGPDLLHTAKRLKAIPTDASASALVPDIKLLWPQKRAVELNTALLAGVLRKIPSAIQLAERARELYPDPDGLISLTLLGLSNNPPKRTGTKTTAISSTSTASAALLEALSTLASSTHSTSYFVLLALVQQHLRMGSVENAAEAVKRYLETASSSTASATASSSTESAIVSASVWRPGVVSLGAWLLRECGRIDEAVEMLDEAVEYWCAHPVYKNRATTLQSHVAHFKHIQCNRAQAACRDYERLLRADRGADPRFLAGLVLSAADCDMAAAELWAGRMENVETLLSRAKSKEAMEGVRTSLAGKIDVDLLESRPFANVSNPIRSGTKGGEIKGVGDVKTEEKKRRKRKKIMPKSFDPNVVPDPERWLPKHERSAFKKQKRGKASDLNKGPQGAVTSGPGALGGTGSARIAGREALVSEPIAVAPIATVVSEPKKSKKKNKK